MKYTNVLRNVDLKLCLNKQLHCLIIILFYVSISYGIKTESIRFKKFDDKLGLSNNWVNAITEDDRGFIWVATRNGLNVYDGNKNQIFTFNHNDPNSVSFNDISEVKYVSKGYVFVGTWGGGLNIINSRTRQVTRIGKSKLEKSLFVKSIIEDGNSNVWISTYGQGNFNFDFETQELIKFEHKENKSKFSYNQDMTYYDDTVWVISRNDGLGFINTNSEEKIIHSYNKLLIKDIAHISIIGRNLYMGSFNGEVMRFNPKKSVLDTLFNLKLVLGHHNRVNSIVEDFGHNLWFSTSSGLFKYSQMKDVLTKINQPEDMEDYNDNFCSFVDSRGVLWLGTWGNGLYTQTDHDQKFEKLELGKSNPNIIQSIQPVNDSILLLGTSNGIMEYNLIAKTSKKVNPIGQESINITNNIINGIMTYKNDFLIMVDAAGLFLMDRMYRISRLENGRNSILYNSSAIGINSLQNGDRWIGTWSKGGARLNENTGFYREFSTRTENDTSLHCNTVYCSFLTKTGKTLVGTEGGILEYNSQKDKFTNIPLYTHLKGEKVKVNGVRSIVEDRNGNLWIASIQGLIKYDPNTYVDELVLREENGLINKLIHNMVYIGNTIWATTKSGLIQINTESNSIENYTVTDGLPSNSFNDNGLYYDGQLLYLALGANVVYFDPKKVSKSERVVELEILNFRLNDNIIESTNSVLKNHISNCPEIKLKYNENNISFDIAVLDFESPLDGKFVHKLEGFDEKWIEHTYSNSKIRYTNLKGGDYILKLAVVLEDNSISEIKKSIVIKIIPPFWQTFWFKFVLVVFVIITFIFVLRLRTKRVINQNKLLETQVKKRTAELEESNINLNEQKQAVESNIKYAAVLQNAIMPTDEIIKSSFENIFIFNRPRDGVSGDFYWFSKVGTKSIFVVADCTGHGVSGAFVSVLGISALSSIVESKKILQPDLILNALQERVRTDFSKSKKTINDGMDIAVICYDYESKILEISSANSSPLLIFGNAELLRLRGDKFSIGNTEAMNSASKKFTLKTFNIEEPSTIYLFSDGFQDQFGGINDTKYMQKKFREFLFGLRNKTTEEQAVLIENELANWKQDKQQTDDILVVGIQLS